MHPRTVFSEFYDNPIVRALAPIPRWTVSGQLGEPAGTPTPGTNLTSARKAPIDIRALLDTGRVRGAFDISKTCLTGLDEITERLPTAANVAFYLQAQSDGVLVLDIEPDCPPAISAQLLALPGIRWPEYSMSGRGYHLVFELPSNFDAFPLAATKRVLREEHGWYELLLDHWITFTRRPVDPSLGNLTPGGHHPSPGAPSPGVPDAAPAPATIDDVYARMAEHARATPSSPASAIDTGGPGTLAEALSAIPFAEVIAAQVLTDVRSRLRDPGEFHHDLSRWEFSVLGSLYRALLPLLGGYAAVTGTSYSIPDRVWLLAHLATQVIPPRPKHDERRNGRPYLVDRAAALVADRTAAEPSVP